MMESPLWNTDLAPAGERQRTWSWVNISALWVGMVVSVPAYLLASGLMQEGMAWWQAVVTIFLGNLIVMIPMMLNGHAGAKYGVPFPVLLRASFGTAGAKLPALLRGLVACGWFGIQTWVGGFAIYQILNAVSGDVFVGEAIPVIGIDLAQLSCFLAFWLLQLVFVQKGTESIRWLETLAAPFLLLTALALLAWAYIRAGGFGDMLSAPSAFVEGGEREGEFWQVFWPGLTAMVGFWATMSLNIPDFTRYARSQRDQLLGQALGLPVPMALLALVSVFVTSATVLIFGEAIWDPVVIAGRLDGAGVVLGLLALTIATLTTNLAANVVAPANGFSNLAPERISFRLGGYITAGLGIAIMPWKLLESAGAYLFIWLIGYSSLLGPIAGIMITDYFFVRKCRLETAELYREHGAYSYTKGWNLNAIIALCLGIAPTVPGFFNTTGLSDDIPSFFIGLYDYAWFVGALLAGMIYYLLMRFDFQREREQVRPSSH
ncbi:MAG: NCS1 family nucleobase:cation symporter-1 [Gammaproteobacteria bacterium]|nr:NCS1 family nucleobase:cation symporter-1 [Gammaproteobacteria bacterium]